MSERPHAARDFLITILPVLWIGTVIGVSFIATPAKFQVPDLDRTAALLISIVTFAWLHMAEAIIAVVLAVVLLFAGGRWPQWLALVLASAILALQVDWILPGFEGRSGIIPGLPALDFRQLHTAFAITEGVKIAALLALSFIAFRGRGMMGAGSGAEDTAVAR